MGTGRTEAEKIAVNTALKTAVITSARWWQWFSPSCFLVAVIPQTRQKFSEHFSDEFIRLIHLSSFKKNAYGKYVCHTYEYMCSLTVEVM